MTEPQLYNKHIYVDWSSPYTITLRLRETTEFLIQDICN